MRARPVAVMAALAFGMSIFQPLPAMAGVRPLPSVSVLSFGSGFDESAADREFVLWLAQYDPRAIVRSTAWNAILDPGGDDAIQRFLFEEFVFAEELADGTKARNADFVAWVLDTHTPEYSPEVVAAARYAADRKDSDRDVFVRSGYAAAKLRDQHVREADGRQAAALVESDRAFVRGVRDHDPGAQVRAAADWALREGAGDSELVEFFAYGWASAAHLDLNAHRLALAGNDVRWRNTIAQLILDAQAAEKAAREAAGEAAVQAREKAARAWASVGEQTEPARNAWHDAEEVALAQAAVWQQVAAAAAAAQSPNWAPMEDAAGELGEQWAVDQQSAAGQAAYWVALFEQARESELAMQEPAR